MRIELTEVLACPVCLPDEQGLVAVVDERAGGRIEQGYLGCPRCDSRHPIRGGAVRFAGGGSDPGGRSGPGPSATGGPSGAVASETGDRPGVRPRVERPAVEMTALLGVAEGGQGGVVIVDEGLSDAAASLAALAPGLEVLALVRRPRGGSAGGEPTDGDVEGASAGDSDLPEVGTSAEAEERVTALWGVPPTLLPVRSGRLRGVALLGGGAARVREAARALAPGGRLVVLRPVADAAAAAEEASLRVLAAEQRALVAHVAGTGDRL